MVKQRPVLQFVASDARTKEKLFQCPITCGQCVYVYPAGYRPAAKVGQQCGRSVCIGFPLCHSHLTTVCHVKIAVSEALRKRGITGKGLYAWDKNAPIVFRKDSKILPYNPSDMITWQQNDARYPGDLTAPYGSTRHDLDLAVPALNRVWDAACDRIATSLVNDPRGTGKRANAKFVDPTAGGPSYLRASRNIRHGQEILVSYGPNYWERGVFSYWNVKKRKWLPKLDYRDARLVPRTMKKAWGFNTKRPRVQQACAGMYRAGNAPMKKAKKKVKHY